MEAKQLDRKVEVDISIREEENGFRIIFTRTGALRGKRAEYVARSLDEFLAAAGVEALMKLQ